MSSNHCFEFEFPAQIYKTQKQRLNKAWKGEQKNGACMVYLFLVYGSITVHMVSSLTGLDLTKHENMLFYVWNETTESKLGGLMGP